MRIIAAVRNEYDFNKAVMSGADRIFLLNPNILNINDKVKQAHSAAKKIFVHIDLAEGIGKDKAGLVFLKTVGVDGIISTRVNIIKAAKEAGLFTVQRFFIVDSHSLYTTIEAVKSSKADMIEIMPGIVVKVIEKLKEKLDVPIIAGGLIDSEEEIALAVKNGAWGISTRKADMWR